MKRKHGTMATEDLHQARECQANESLPSIAWENVLILDTKTVDTIYKRIEEHLSIKKFGFKVIKRSDVKKFINNKMGDLNTTNGQRLCRMECTVTMIMTLRSHHVTKKAMRGSTNAHRVLHDPQFQIMVAPFQYTGHHTRHFDDNDVEKWIQMAISHGIPPYVLMVQYLINEGIITASKELKDIICGIATTHYNPTMGTILENKSFRTFCLRISERDQTSFHGETDKNKISKAFERFVYNKMKRLLEERKSTVTMKTEKELREEWDTKCFGIARNKRPPTPDILLSSPVLINGIKVNWIESKSYFLSQRDGYLLKRIEKTSKKYNKHYGQGAYVMRGFEEGIKRIAKVNSLLLDSSIDFMGQLHQDEVGLDVVGYGSKEKRKVVYSHKLKRRQFGGLKGTGREQ